MVTLFDRQMRDAAERSCANVHIGLRFDLTRAAHNGGKVLTRDLCSRYRSVSSPVVQHSANRDSGHDQKDQHDQQDFLYAHGLQSRVREHTLHRTPWCIRPSKV